MLESVLSSFQQEKFMKYTLRSLQACLVVLSISAVGSALAAGPSESDARRFLSRATFGPTPEDVSAVMASSKSDWLKRQFAMPASGYAGATYLDPNPKVGCPTGAPTTCMRDNYSSFPVQVQFFKNAMYGPDQLRQRVALALSEILVISGHQIRQPYALANYQRLLSDNAFGNFKTILREVTLSPAMGEYLNMVNNDKPNLARGTEPNENYAREVLQLFSIGLTELRDDGTPRVDATGVPLKTYDQDVVEGFAHAFTGWTYPPRPGAVSRFPNPKNYDGRMVAFDTRHDQLSKKLLNGVTLPPGKSAAADLESAIDNIFQHPNVGPFIGLQLIQHLVTSNPSPAYVARVTAAFNGTSTGIRGDMKAVISAILLDPEATTPANPATFGKLREPALQVLNLFRTLGGKSDGVWLRAAAASLGEPVFSPPTVFGFFSPDYALPDSPDLDGPAFGLYNANTAFVLSGVLGTAINPNGVGPDSSVQGATGSKIDLTGWSKLAANPDLLAGEINRVLFAGTMSGTLRSAVARAVLTLSAGNPSGRVRAAIFLAVMSPEFLVEH